MNAYIWVKNGIKDRIDIPDIHILDILTVTGSLEGVPQSKVCLVGFF